MQNSQTRTQCKIPYSTDDVLPEQHNTTYC